MTATKDDFYKPWQWWPQGRQWWPQRMISTNHDSDGHWVDSDIIVVAIIFCGRHCHGLWPSSFGRHCHSLWPSFFCGRHRSLRRCCPSYGRYCLWPSLSNPEQMWLSRKCTSTVDACRQQHSLHYTLPLPTLNAIICWHLPHHRPWDGYPVDSVNCCLIGIGIGQWLILPIPNYNPILHSGP